MDLWQLIKNDHVNAAELFQEILRESSGDLREKLFRQLRRELEAHAKVEEDHFYPALERQEKTRKLVAEARQAHEDIKMRLQDLDGGSKDGEDWARRLQELQGVVWRHVEAEEGTIFPEARTVISDAQADEMMHRIEQEKTKLIQREPA